MHLPMLFVRDLMWRVVVDDVVAVGGFPVGFVVADGSHFVD